MFPCKKCGTCCKNIGAIEQLKAFDNGNGVCKWLVDDLCSIYSSRPDICRVDYMYEKEYYKIYSREEYYLLNLYGCDTLKHQS